jgi:hypothetical protein
MEEKKYWVHIPIHEYWIYEVMAKSVDEAIQLANDPRSERSQVCSMGCGKNAKIKVEVRSD